MPFQIIRNDITKVKADAIVNTANPNPTYGSGTDYAVYTAAGAERLLKERKKIGAIHPGEAAVTRAFRLHAKYIIHTVGPSWKDGQHGEFDILASCYRKSLLLAKQLGCKSIAFPLIATGVYGFPKDEALSIALQVFSDFLEEEENEMDITLVVFNKDAFELSASLAEEVRQYIDDHYVAEKQEEEYGSWNEDDRIESNEYRRNRRLLEALRREEAFESSSQGGYGSLHEAAPMMAPEPKADMAEDMPMMAPMPDLAVSMPAKPRPSAVHTASKKAAARPNLDDMMRHVGESFQEMLLRLIDEKGMTDTQVYKRANIDRKLFSKIRCKADYTPKKQTALALALALRLNLDETTDLLRRAGYALSPSSLSDVVIEFCIRSSRFEMYEVNSILFQYGLPELP